MRLSIDRLEVKDGKVRCAVRDREVPVEECAQCARLVEVRPAAAPLEVVCDGYAFASWLGIASPE